MGDLKEHLRWQAESGASGVPRDPDLAERLKQNPLPHFSAPARRERDVQPHSAQQPQQHAAQQHSAQQHAAQQQPAPAGTTAAQPATEAPAHQPPGAPKQGGFKAPDLDGFASGEGKRASHIASKKLPAVQKADRTHLATLGSTLDELRDKVKDCTQCELHSGRKQTVFSRGSGSSGLVFVGEGPGADEDAQGEPFVGAAGQLLDKMIAAMGMDRDEVYICNIVKCRPPNNRKPSPQEMQSCTPYLQQQLELLKPQVIVALGGTAVTGLLGVTDGITRIRGKFRLYEGRIAVMPTFHPAYLLRNASAKRQVWTDLRQVLVHLGRDVPAKR